MARKITVTRTIHDEQFFAFTGCGLLLEKPEAQQSVGPEILQQFSDLSARWKAERKDGVSRRLKQDMVSLIDTLTMRLASEPDPGSRASRTFYALLATLYSVTEATRKMLLANEGKCLALDTSREMQGLEPITMTDEEIRVARGGKPKDPKRVAAAQKAAATRKRNKLLQDPNAIWQALSDSFAATSLKLDPEAAQA